MDTIGKLEYPNQTTFTETFEIAKDCVNRYGGFMTNIVITGKLGYNFKNANQISGWIYRRFDDMAGFGLFTRERGGVRITALGKEATDPYDQEKARQGKAKAIFKFPLLKKAAEDWKMEVPDQDAFPAKLAELAAVDWVEAKKHSEVLQKLISDCFTHLRPTINVGVGMAGVHSTTVADSGFTPVPELGKQAAPTLETGPIGYGKPFGELRTIVGTVVVKNMATLRLARSTLDVLEEEIKESEANEKAEKSKASKESKSGKNSGEDSKTPDK